MTSLVSNHSRNIPFTTCLREKLCMVDLHFLPNEIYLEFIRGYLSYNDWLSLMNTSKCEFHDLKLRTVYWRLNNFYSQLYIDAVTSSSSDEDSSAITFLHALHNSCAVPEYQISLKLQNPKFGCRAVQPDFSLSVHSIEMDGYFLPFLLPSFSSVSSLKVVNAPLLISITIPNYCYCEGALQSLALVNCPQLVSLEGLNIFSGLLKSISIINCNRLRNVEEIVGLQEIILQDCRNVDVNAVLKISGQQTKVHLLNSFHPTKQADILIRSLLGKLSAVPDVSLANIDVEDLSVLSSASHLSLYNCHAIKELLPLANLLTLKMVDCPKVESIPYFPSLVEVIIHDNHAIVDVSKLGHLQKVELCRMDGITNIDVLANVKTISIDSCNSVYECSNLGVHQDEVSLRYCPLIVDINHLNGVSNLQIEGLSGLYDHGICELGVHQTLSITNCSEITEVRHLQEVPCLRLSNCPNLIAL